MKTNWMKQVPPSPKRVSYRPRRRITYHVEGGRGGTNLNGLVRRDKVSADDIAVIETYERLRLEATDRQGRRRLRGFLHQLKVVYPRMYDFLTK